MARGDAEKKAKWSAWITAQLNARGWSAVDLIRASGGELNDSTISNWKVGRAGVSSEVAVTVADALGVDLVEVLHAGGHDVLAAAVARLQMGKPLRDAATPADPTDSYLRDLMADPAFSDADRAHVINHYLALEKAFKEAESRAGEERRAAAADAARAFGRSIADRGNGV